MTRPLHQAAWKVSVYVGIQPTAMGSIGARWAWSLGRVYQAQGDYHRAIDCLSQTVASFEEEQRYERCGVLILPAVNARAALARCHAEPGWAGCTASPAVVHRPALLWLPLSRCPVPWT